MTTAPAYDEIKALALALPADSRKRLVSVLDDSVGRFPIITLCIEDLLERDDLPPGTTEDEAFRACNYVFRKADGGGDHLSNLLDWAVDVVRS